MGAPQRSDRARTTHYSATQKECFNFARKLSLSGVLGHKNRPYAISTLTLHEGLMHQRVNEPRMKFRGNLIFI